MLGLTFRGRMVGAVTAVTVVTLGGAFAAVSLLVNRSQERQLDEALVAEAIEEASEAAALGGAQLAISDRPGPAANDVGPLTKYGAIYDSDEKVLASTPTFNGRPPALATLRHAPGQCFDVRFHGEHLRAVLVEIPGRAGVLLMLAAPRADLDGDAAFLLRAVLIVLVVGVAWAAIVAQWIVRRLTRDHAAIASTARRVASGDLAARVVARSQDPEMVQLARDVNEMIDRMSVLLASQNRFIAYAAHELRSPLAALYGELSLALRRERDAASYRTSIEEGLDSTRRLKDLAEDLLLLARVSAAPDEPTEQMGVAEVLADSLRLVEAERAARALAITVTGSCRDVQARRPELVRLFRNLVENAVRHSPEGGAVKLVLSDDEDDVVVTIEDEGQGIAPDDRERIFEPFYRGAGAKRTQADPPGAGLGLAIARQVARAHGGDVHLGPDAGAGAVFVVRLRA